MAFLSTGISSLEIEMARHGIFGSSNPYDVPTDMPACRAEQILTRLGNTEVGQRILEGHGIGSQNGSRAGEAIPLMPGLTYEYVGIEEGNTRLTRELSQAVEDLLRDYPEEWQSQRILLNPEPFMKSRQYNRALRNSTTTRSTIQVNGGTLTRTSTEGAPAEYIFERPRPNGGDRSRYVWSQGGATMREIFGRDNRSVVRTEPIDPRNVQTLTRGMSAATDQLRASRTPSEQTGAEAIAPSQPEAVWKRKLLGRLGIGRVRK